jgi:hypothetical protein
VDGLDNLLEDRDQELFDLAAEREGRRETHGYVAPLDARAFIDAARNVQLHGDRPPPSPIVHAYFRTITQPLEDAEPGDARSTAGSGDSPPGVDPGAMAAVFELLRDAGVISAEPRALLGGAHDETRLSKIQAHVEANPAAAGELAFLANALIAGCAVQDRAFTPSEASDAAAAVCNLGLENWPPRWGDPDLATAFQAGWAILHRDVCLCAADRLTQVLATLRCGDRDIQAGLEVLRRELTRHRRDAVPWQARQAFDVLMMLDAPAWAALLGLIAACPVMHAAIGARERRARSINASEFEFISQNRQIIAIRAFLERLPAMLTS